MIKSISPVNGPCSPANTDTLDLSLYACVYMYVFVVAVKLHLIYYILFLQVFS